MKILWHSHSPRVKTGYGTPTALLLPRFRDLGHEVIASAFFGESEELSSFEGIPVYNTNDQKLGATVLKQLADMVQADLIITHMDAWALDPDAINAIRRKVAHWSTADTNPLGELDRAYYSRSASSRLCMSRFSARMLTEGGFPALYVPYAFDPAVFYPDDVGRKELRESSGLDDTFIVGINSANVERKGWPEMLQAFARFQKQHPGDVALFANTTHNHTGALPLAGIAQKAGIPPESVLWGIPGLTSQTQLASWYRTIDVLMACPYGEGFGIPLLESQACGTPVITTDMPPLNDEVATPGWHAASEPLWSTMHQSWWRRPSIAAIHECLEKAFTSRGDRAAPSQAAVSHASTYTVSNVIPAWADVIEQIMKGSK